MDFVIIFIVLMLVIFAFVGWIVYWAISHSAKKNKVYQAFASEHGYQFDKAQGNDYYREYSKQKTSNDLTLKLFQNPYVEKYANFSHYPFGRGNMVKVAYVISGNYNGSQFRAFTYHFEGNAIENSGPGGVFSIVMIQCPDEPKGQLSEQMFYENGMLCEYLRENLNVETIHDRIDKLKYIAKGV